MLRALALGVVLAMAVTMSGCVVASDNSTQHRPTLGAELTDLKTALDHGAITQAEYDQKKAQLLAQH